MNSNHTPGPWVYVGDDDGDFVVFAKDEPESNDFVANVDSGMMHPIYDNPQQMVAFDVNQANARLIVTAPDMLKALGTVVDVLESSDPAICDTILVPDGQSETLRDHCLSVIAKAKGVPSDEQ